MSLLPTLWSPVRSSSDVVAPGPLLGGRRPSASVASSRRDSFGGSPARSCASESSWIDAACSPPSSRGSSWVGSPWGSPRRDSSPGRGPDKELREQLARAFERSDLQLQHACDDAMSATVGAARMPGYLPGSGASSDSDLSLHQRLHGWCETYQLPRHSVIGVQLRLAEVEADADEQVSACMHAMEQLLASGVRERLGNAISALLTIDKLSVMQACTAGALRVRACGGTQPIDELLGFLARGASASKVNRRASRLCQQALLPTQTETDTDI